MNFFASQEAARRKTRVLLGYYALAVCGIVGAFYFAFAHRRIGVAGMDSEEGQQIVGHSSHGAGFCVLGWDGTWMLFTVAISLAIIGGATLFRRASLAEGGASVARSAGGREINPETRDIAERRLLNVVEEMALASGVPIPRVYVLDNESGINAFAAGFSTRDAAIAVTQGALDTLQRDELQGVIAHEFSHILNGDMRLNSWLIGVLFGILATSVIGRVLMESLRGVRVSGGKKGGGGIVLLIFLSGLALWAIGSIGVLFARLIQASVCRQREYLADASAVQFTRNPLGLAGALKRIGAMCRWSSLSCSSRDELAHLLFSAASRSESFFATHPPLLKRILSLDPAFNGDFGPWRVGGPVYTKDGQLASAVRSAAVVSSLSGGLSSAGVPPSVTEIAGRVSPDMRRSVANPMEAACALYGLLLSGDPNVRQRQRECIVSRESLPVAEAAERWHDTLGNKDRTTRRMLAELAVAGCRRRTPDGRAVSLALVKELAATDGSISLFEYMLQNSATRSLKPEVSLGVFRPLPPAQVKGEAVTVLGVLAYAGQPSDDAAAEAAWRAGAAHATSFGIADLLPTRDSCTLAGLDYALRRLKGLAPLLKQELLSACAFVVRADGRLTPDEAELLRSVADALEMPLPSVDAVAAA